jgi:hypothetical protein
MNILILESQTHGLFARMLEKRENIVYEINRIAFEQMRAHSKDPSAHYEHLEKNIEIYKLTLEELLGSLILNNLKGEYAIKRKPIDDDKAFRWLMKNSYNFIEYES